VTRTRLAIVIAFILVLAACNGGRPPKIGETAPNFTVTDGQRSVTLDQLRGKPVLLNFWASWCAPCVEEMPSLVQLQKVMGNKVTIFAVSVDSDEKAYQQFIRDHNVDLLTVRDAKQASNTLYGTFKFPETYVIDKDGKILRKFIGAVDWTSPDIVDYLQKL
jgi:thiol-disulfide isomerase/thioredoxin